MNRLKKISTKDIDRLHKHYLKFEPYSDFNVVSIWGYMVPGARYLEDGGSVLYEMTDYNNGEKFLSIFGNNSVKKIIKRVAKNTSDEKLKFYNVPASTCDSIASWSAIDSIEPEESNHDYIFSVDSIAELSSENLRHKRKNLNKLKKTYPDLMAKVIDHKDPKNRRTMYSLFKRWIKQSGSNSWHREYRALQRALNIENFKVVCIGAYDNNKLVGFTVNEIEMNGYYQGHYGKADYNYRGLGLYLENETAKYIRDNYHVQYMNLQQDLGIEGIRYYKNSLGPIKQLKKYTLVIDTQKARKN